MTGCYPFACVKKLWGRLTGFALRPEVLNRCWHSIACSAPERQGMNGLFRRRIWLCCGAAPDVPERVRGVRRGARRGQAVDEIWTKYGRTVDEAQTHGRQHAGRPVGKIRRQVGRCSGRADRYVQGKQVREGMNGQVQRGRGVKRRIDVSTRNRLAFFMRML